MNIEACLCCSLRVLSKGASSFGAFRFRETNRNVGLECDFAGILASDLDRIARILGLK